MKRFLLLAAALILAFLVLTALADGLNLFLVRQSTGNNLYKTARLFQSHEDEVPILGSSRAQANFVPSILGPKVFNYGIDGSGLGETLFRLHYLVTYKSKGLIIVNVDPWGGTSGPFHGDYRLAAFDSSIRALLPTGTVPSFDWMPGIRFQGQLRNNLVQFFNAKRAVTKQIDAGAMLIKTSRSDSEWAYIDSQLKPLSFTHPDTSCDRLLSRIQSELIAKPDINVLFVIGPCTESWSRSFIGHPDLTHFVQRLQQLRCRVVNYYGNTVFTRDDFVDSTHLNIHGAKKFSEMLKHEIDIP